MTTNALRNAHNLTDALNLSVPNSKTSQGEEGMWRAVLGRDPSQDGGFVFAVSSTGIFCRPSCSARHPRRENVTFFREPSEAEKAGYRACLRCKPKSAERNPNYKLVKSVCRHIEQHLDEPITLSALGAKFNRSPFHLQRTFKAILGVTPQRLRRVLPDETTEAQFTGRSFRDSRHVRRGIQFQQPLI